MRLEAFVDFYFLEAIQSAPLDMMRKPQERLKLDAIKHFNEFCNNFALAIRDYLYVAAFGEARHARPRAIKYWPGNYDYFSRSSSYKLAIKYNPEEALPLLYELFTSPWKGTYGGAKWAEIVKAAMMYGNIPNAVFIDHAADLQHWNGFVFSKFEAKEVLDWHFDDDAFNLMKSWLNYKAKTIDLLHLPEISILPSKISVTTQSLLSRYYNVTYSPTTLPKWWNQQETLKGNPYQYKPLKFEGRKIPQELTATQIQYTHYIKEIPEFSKECACITCTNKTITEANNVMKSMIEVHKKLLMQLEKEIHNFNGQKTQEKPKQTYTIYAGDTASA